MEAAKHTQGPWEAIQCGNSFIVTAKDRMYDVAVVRNIGNEDNASNASLIAAAPDLLEALREVVDQCDGYVPNTSKATWRKAFAAIAKATGSK